MRVNFGLVVDDKQEHIAHIEVPTDNLLSAAELISAKYLGFKQVLDKYGYNTYLELCEEIAELPNLIDKCLDPILVDDK